MTIVVDLDVKQHSNKQNCYCLLTANGKVHKGSFESVKWKTKNQCFRFKANRFVETVARLDTDY